MPAHRANAWRPFAGRLHRPTSRLPVLAVQQLPLLRDHTAAAVRVPQFAEGAGLLLANVKVPPAPCCHASVPAGGRGAQRRCG